ncbi:efflux RND transporter periplasmic adaptor subunit [bacterium]|nr:efflux RND transporter periplasmic adaptor subunit [bacterium]
MKQRTTLVISGALVVFSLIAGLAIMGLQPEPARAAEEKDADASLYVCSMHPWEASHDADESCTICGMGLSQVEGYKAGDPMPEEDDLYVDPNSPMKVSLTQHDGWIPIKESPFYQPKKMDDGAMDHSGHDHGAMNHEMPMHENVYVCSMHPWETAFVAGSKCDLCGMGLSQVKGYSKGDPVPGEDELFVDPDNPMKVSVTQHDGWIPITKSPYYQPKSTDDSQHEGHGGQGHDSDSDMDHSMQTRSTQESTASADSGTLWTCGMHPEVIQDEPGICPICQMDLTPLKQSTASGGGATVSIDPVTLQNIGVVTVPAERTDLYRSIRSNGTVTVAEENEVRVNARVSGWIERLYVDRTGDPVRKGQTLLEIYSPELVAAQEEYILALKNGEALAGSSIQHVSQGGQDLVDAAKRRLQLWNIADSEIERLERTREVQRTLPFNAPASGIVLSKNVVEGASVKAGMDLFTIANLDEIWVTAQLYEYELPWVREGDPVTVSSSYDPGLELSGRVDYIYPTLNAQSRTAEARIVLDNPGLKLKPDMYVDVRMQSSPVTDVVAVPKSAVIRSGERDIVFVKVGDGQFEPRQVHLGLETDSQYEITHNLDAGEQVVTSAQFLLDSEATLQEAIQRRIAQRRAMGQDATADAGAMSGHQH